MSPVSVRQDEVGLYVRVNRMTFRPGGVSGLDHAYRMDSGGLIQGEQVHASYWDRNRTADVPDSQG